MNNQTGAVVPVTDGEGVLQPVSVIPQPPPRPLSPIAKSLVEAFEKPSHHTPGKRIAVNPMVSKFASWYERLRNVMEYRDEEMMLRAATERILRRMLLLGGNAKSTAEPLVRELMWARYLPPDQMSEATITKVEQSIDLHLRLRMLVIQRHKLRESDLNDLIYALMSSDIEQTLRPSHEKDTVANFMFHVLKDDVVIVDDSEETRDAQVYIAVRKSFARDDVAFLKYHILQLYFGKLTEQSLHNIAETFMQGYQEMMKQLKYPRKERIYTFVKRRTAAFLILEDIFRSHKRNIEGFATNEEELEKAIYNACTEKYEAISSKVQRAVIRSVFFILLTKVIFAFAIEGTYETWRYGHILWPQLIANVIVPPMLMMIVGIFLRAPGPDNTARIIDAIKLTLYEDNPRFGDVLMLKKKRERPNIIFTVLWFLAFFVSFGSIVYILQRFGFNIASIGVFLFFLAIVSFLAYRISLLSSKYSMYEKQSFVTPFVDFFFMPVVQVGRRLATNISKLNIMLFIFDFLIETPFKLLIAFFEQWFVFLHSKREELE